MIEYAMKHGDKLINGLLEHLEILTITLLISVAIAAILTVSAEYLPKLGSLLISIFSIIYAIPSLALFAILIPVTGLGMKTAIIVLVIYNQYLLLRSFFISLQEIEPAVTDAAAGQGMTKMQVLLKIKIPLGKKGIFTGIRLATVSTIGIATIAACINAGGLGTILFDGLRTVNTVKIMWGTVLSAGLAIAANTILNKLEKLL